MQVVVNYDNLIQILENYIKSFNDCTCCPMQFKCEEEPDRYKHIDIYDCSRYIRDYFLQVD